MARAIYALVEHFDNLYVIDLYKYGPVYNKTHKYLDFFGKAMLILL